MPAYMPFTHNLSNHIYKCLPASRLTCSMRQIEQSVYVDANLLDDIEQAAQNREQSISEFFREAARRELQRKVDHD